MTRCDCHDVVVFGHGPNCTAGLWWLPRTYRDFKAELAERALSARLEELSSRDILKGRTMPRGKNAVNGGWPKKRG